MAVILPCFLLVFVSEMGDKTQLLALVLALRFRRPWLVMAGILVATVANHGLASCVGGAAAAWIGPRALRWGLAATFLGFAAWLLVPDKEEAPTEGGTARAGVFVTTVVSFFLAEMGDKTQLATIALGARYADPLRVTLGSSLGMLAADGLAVFLGERLTARIPMAWVRRGASLLFALFGLALLWRG